MLGVRVVVSVGDIVGYVCVVVMFSVTTVVITAVGGVSICVVVVIIVVGVCPQYWRYSRCPTLVRCCCRCYGCWSY